MGGWKGGWDGQVIIYKVHARESSPPSSMFWSWSLDLQIGQTGAIGHATKQRSE